jgi:hypothetical protein
MPTDKIVYEIDLQISGESGGVYIRSKDVPGLHLRGTNLRTMKPTVEKAIKRLFKDNRGIDVNVLWVAEVAQLPAKKRAATPQPSRIMVYPEQREAA